MKKKTVSPRQKHLAGEAVEPAVLSPSEERLFSSLFSVSHEWHGDNTDLPAAASAAEMRVRDEAARASLPFFCQRLEGKKYGREEISSALATAVSLPVCLTEWCAEPESFLSGAAYWILDYVQERRMEDKLFPLLPKSEKVRTVLSVPNTDDLFLDKSVVLRLTELLLERKSGKQKEFRKLIGLIKKEDAAKLRAAFRDALLDYFTRFLQVRTRVKARSSSSANATLARLPAGDSPLAPLSAADPLSLLPSADPARPLAPLPAVKDLLDSGGKENFPAFSRDVLKQRPDLCFLLKTPDLIGASPEKLQAELHYRRMTSLLSDFTVADPYAICAAYVLLERENDLLIHLNALTAAVLACADRHLPWSYEEADVWQRLTKDEAPDYVMRYPFQPPEQTEEAPEQDSGHDRESWGTWEEDAGSLIESGRLLSEVQLFYLATGYLFPRRHCGTQRLKAWFMKNGVPAERAGELSFGAMLLSRLDEGEALELLDGLEAEAEAEEEEAPPPEKVEVQAESEEKIADLTRQLKASRQALHDAEQSARQMRAQIQESEKRSVQDRMELSGLRETLFRMKSGEESPEERLPDGLEFPWQVKRRILIFGGHDTWSKAIRPLLPGARFFERESLPDLNAIKGADVVWIQANALSHKFYYRIIDTARREGIPVQYFSFASARKCAEQLAAYELSAETE